MARVCADLANSGRTVALTIHQPRWALLEAFGRVLLVADGRICYRGSLNALPPFLATHGFACEPGENPADAEAGVDPPTRAEGGLLRLAADCTGTPLDARRGSIVFIVPVSA